MARKTEVPSSVDAWQEAAVLIAQEIRLWSQQVLEHPLPAFGDLPPCPYARAAWLNEQVMVHVCMDIETVTEIKACMPPTEDMLHIVAWTDWDELSAEEFQEWIEAQNKNHMGVWIMGFHPESPDEPLTPEFEGLDTDDYAILLVQSLSHLVRASDALRKTRYYEQFPPEDMTYVDERKEIADAWHEKVNEEVFHDQEDEAIARFLSEEGHFN